MLTIFTDGAAIKNTQNTNTLDVRGGLLYLPVVTCQSLMNAYIPAHTLSGTHHLLLANEPK